MCTKPIPCYQPINKDGKPTGEKLKFKRPDNVHLYKKIAVGCGKCPSCLVARARDWAVRIYCELKTSPGPCWFVTITYDPEHLPYGNTLQPDDMRLFIKKIRNHYPKYKVKYLYVGEYGEDHGRAHYHICLFNTDLTDLEQVGMSSGMPIFESAKLTKLWGKGIVSIGTLTPKSAYYCAQYINKKIFGEKAEAHYNKICKDTGEIISQLPEFNRMSRKPALGTDFFNKYRKQYDCPELDFFVLPGGIKVPQTKHFDKMLKAEAPELLEIIKEERIKKAKKLTPEELKKQHKFDTMRMQRNKKLRKKVK